MYILSKTTNKTNNSYEPRKYSIILFEALKKFIALKNQLKKNMHNGILSYETKDTLNVRVVDHDVGYSEIFKLSNLPIFPRMV